MFKTFILAVIVISCSGGLYGSSATNNDSHKFTEETTGFFSGAILGGFAGGPSGVIFGAAFGALLGDKWLSNKEALREAQFALEKSDTELTLIRDQLADINRNHSLSQSENHRRLISLNDISELPEISKRDPSCCEAKISIHFKTGHSEIEEHYKEELKMISSQARHRENSTIEIFGYADRSGDSASNLELSKERINSVRRFLTQNGIDQSFVSTVAYGDTNPLEPNSSYETDFFDRRVTIYLKAGGNAATKVHAKGLQEKKGIP